MDVQGPLPTEQDFNPWGEDDPDAQWAWKNFGGLTVQQAKAKFTKEPLWYLEDFMFMGGRAFAYYFPVIEDHLRTVPDRLHDDDRHAWFLGCSIARQFDAEAIDHVKPLAPTVINRAQFVLNNIDRFGILETERIRVVETWTALITRIEAIIGR